MLTVAAGAYDGTLHGWQGDLDAEGGLQLAFAFRAHDSCIRAMDALGKLACSAASDESIQVYDLSSRRVLDRMSGVHEAEITALAFARDKVGEVFLLSGDASGRIYAWTMQKRKVIHELKGHKQSSAVTSIAIHPSGRVALSTAKDNSLRLWDLVNAKAAPRTKLGDFKVLSGVCWAPPDGAHFAVIGDETSVIILDTALGAEKPVGTFVHPKRVNALKFVQDVVVASACDDGAIRIIGADGVLIREFRAPTPCRARDVAYVSRKVVFEDGEEGDQTVIAGVFSDGSIRLWDIENDSDEPLQTLNVGTAAHVTCLSMTWLHARQPVVKVMRRASSGEDAQEGSSSQAGKEAKDDTSSDEEHEGSPEEEAPVVEQKPVRPLRAAKTATKKSAKEVSFKAAESEEPKAVEPKPARKVQPPRAKKAKTTKG